MLADRRFSPIHISELASAVATLELGSGSVKKPRQLFKSFSKKSQPRIVLLKPLGRRGRIARFTSTTSIWIFPTHSRLVLGPSTFKVNGNSRLRSAGYGSSISRFQVDPSVQGSYVSAVALEDYRTSEWFAKLGLMANPEDFTLLNNLAFACINRGDIESAKGALARVDRLLQLSDLEQAVLQATRGLLKFRTGNVAIGRQLYLEARSKARKIQAQDGGRLLALASVFHAIEEVSQEVSDSRPMVSETFEALKRVSDPIFRVLERKLTKITTRPRGGLR